MSFNIRFNAVDKDIAKRQLDRFSDIPPAVKAFIVAALDNMRDPETGPNTESFISVYAKGHLCDGKHGPDNAAAEIGVDWRYLQVN